MSKIPSSGAQLRPISRSCCTLLHADVCVVGCWSLSEQGSVVGRVTLFLLLSHETDIWPSYGIDQENWMCTIVEVIVKDEGLECGAHDSGVDLNSSTTDRDEEINRQVDMARALTSDGVRQDSIVAHYLPCDIRNISPPPAHPPLWTAYPAICPPSSIPHTAPMPQALSHPYRPPSTHSLMAQASR
jgi:hypothetical protein